MTRLFFYLFIFANFLFVSSVIYDYGRIAGIMEASEIFEELKND